MRAKDFARMFHGWLGEKLPVPVELLPQLLGVDVCLADLGNVDGSSQTLGGDAFLIIINRRRPLSCRRFTLAHEIGHLLFCPSSPLQVRPEPVINLEKFANNFASELLMPRSAVLCLWEAYKDNPLNRLTMISERLLVSGTTLRIRFRELGI